jgi:tetratricopeptide (TPR) repeat protein
MSIQEATPERKPDRGFSLARVVRLASLIALGVGGYAAYQLLPSWSQILSSREAAAVRRHAGVLFVDVLLIAYPLAILASILGTVVLVCLRVRARSHGGRRKAEPARSKSQLQARLLLLCVSTMLSLAAFEAGAAAWRSKLHESPNLAVVVPRGEPFDGGDPADPDEDDPDLPGVPERRQPRSPGSAPPLRILVIGESSARGEPYHPWLSVAQIAAWRLEKVFPGRTFQVDMWAKGGVNLETMHNKLTGLSYRPDALMVYVGHNEFQSRYAWMREVDHYLDDHPELGGAQRQWAVKLFLRVSPLFQLLDETREHQRLDALPPRMVTRTLVDRPTCTLAESKAIEEDFERRLESIAVFCESINTLPIFVIPACDDAGWDPSRSVLAAETPRAERAAFAKEVMHARALETKDRSEAVRIYRELVKRHPEFAETHYRLARLLERTGTWDEAREHYVQARELDGLPLRCTERFRQAYRLVAARHPSVLLVDGPRVLEAKSRHGIINFRFFHDAQHPNLAGYIALAEDLMIQLRARHAFGWTDEKAVPAIDADACVRHFDLNAAKWAYVCKRDLGFFRASSYVRFDPDFRNERAVQYLRAGALIREGGSPADAGIPGWPMPPPPAKSHRIPGRQTKTL